MAGVAEASVMSLAFIIVSYNRFGWFSSKKGGWKMRQWTFSEELTIITSRTVIYRIVVSVNNM